MTSGAIVQRPRILVGLGVGGVILLVPASGCFSSNNGSNPPDAAVDRYVAPPLDAPAGNDAPAPDAGPAAEASSGPCLPGWFQGDGGACFISLLGNWIASTDANTDGPDTVATLGTDTAESVSVIPSHTGEAGADCGCNAQHLQIKLGRTFSCSASTLEFVYSTTVVDGGATSSPALDIRFCNGPCRTVVGGGGPQFYGGPQYVGSPAAPGYSNCAYEWENEAGTGSTNYFPASALITSGAITTIPLGSYVAPGSNDTCTGSFDTIDVHMQVYNCGPESAVDTLSSLRIY